MVKFLMGTAFVFLILTFVLFPAAPSLYQFLPRWGSITILAVSAILVAGVMIVKSK